MITIDISDRAHLDENIQRLLVELAICYFDGDMEETLSYVKTMGDCVNIERIDG